ncbi:hypothetical protein [Acidovorax sp. Leaf78]|uniref:hypothetical protein n=1 Tax=unclassified Acidovorax TaxID=2684926 RepID=UPI0009E699FF|nr:hypothetical protein [Acidovorax sp. Leaf78]
MPMSSTLSWRTQWAEYRRPWKLSALAVGIGLLLLGAELTPAPDWDVPISFIMGLLAYATAPWSLRVLMERQWRVLPLAVFMTWFTVDGCYAIYWYVKDPAVLELMRDVNFLASLTLYGMCGLVWLYQGSLRQGWQALCQPRLSRR